MISSTKSRKLAKDQGTYALVLYLPRATDIRVGKLGEHNFPRGYYLYIGSAMNGLAARIARHLSTRIAVQAKAKANNPVGHKPLRKKKLFWHVDYFLQHAQVKEVWTHQGAERFECVWAQAALAMSNARVVAPRLGASDCKCATHLIYFGNRPPRKKE